jgi:hypothetical protein
VILDACLLVNRDIASCRPLSSSTYQISSFTHASGHFNILVLYRINYVAPYYNDIIIKYVSGIELSRSNNSDKINPFSCNIAFLLYYIVILGFHHRSIVSR